MNADERAGADPSAPGMHLLDNSTQERFELYIGDELVGILGYGIETEGTSAGRAGEGTQVAFMHTVIMEEHWRQGLAADLVEFAFTRARERGWLVRPVCTYVQRFVAKNRDFDTILTDAG